MNKSQDYVNLIERYVHQPNRVMVVQDMIADLLNFNPPLVNIKARRVWRKCIKANKYRLAAKIALKYDLVYKGNDLCMASMWCLIATEGKNK